jgi:hypothetical protein
VGICKLKYDGRRRIRGVVAPVPAGGPGEEEGDSYQEDEPEEESSEEKGEAESTDDAKPESVHRCRKCGETFQYLSWLRRHVIRQRCKVDGDSDDGLKKKNPPRNGEKDLTAALGMTLYRCEDCGLKQSNFGKPSDGKRRWCGGCAKEHAGVINNDVITENIDVITEMCEDCTLVAPSYGLPLEERKRWCAGCAQGHAGAVKVRSERSRSCQHCGQSFRYPSWLTRHQRKCQSDAGEATTHNLLEQRTGGLHFDPAEVPAPEGWAWPSEGERIEVEVQVADDAPPVWISSQVLVQVLVDGQFQARIVLPDGSDQWEDWFSWQDEGTDWRRKQSKKRKSSTVNGAAASGAAAEAAPDVAEGEPELAGEAAEELQTGSAPALAPTIKLEPSDSQQQQQQPTCVRSAKRRAVWARGAAGGPGARVEAEAKASSFSCQTYDEWSMQTTREAVD